MSSLGRLSDLPMSGPTDSVTATTQGKDPYHPTYTTYTWKAGNSSMGSPGSKGEID